MTVNWDNLIEIIMDDDDQKLKDIVPSQFPHNAIIPSDFSLNSPVSKLISPNENHSLLTIASELNKIKCAKFLCSSGSDINYQTNSGYTPLLYSVLNDNFDLMIFLINFENINRNLFTIDGYFPIHIAAIEGHLNIMRYLLSQHLYDPNLFTENGNSTTPLILALLSGNDETARILLKNGAKPDLPSKNNVYPLHAAIYGCNINLVIDLFEYPIDKNCRDEEGYTPLLLAAKLRKNDIIKYLLSSPEVDINAATNNEDNILFFSSQKQFILNDILILALQSNYLNEFNFNFQNKQGDTFLHALISNSMMTSSFYLNPIIAKIDPNINNHKGKTALDIAIYKRDYDSIALFLNLKNIEITEYAKKSSILIYAISVQNQKLVELFIRHGFDLNIYNATLKTTPLMMAVMRKNAAIVKQLLATGLVDINKCNDVGQNAFLIASLIRDGGKIIQIMLNHPLLDPNCENKQGETALWNAINTQNLAVCTALLSNSKVNPNYRSKLNVYPFLQAVETGIYSLVVLFLHNKNTDITVSDEDNSNAIHLAILNNSLNILSRIVNYPINIMQESAKYRTPIEMALSMGNLNAALILTNAIDGRLEFSKNLTQEEKHQLQLSQSVKALLEIQQELLEDKPSD